MLLTSWQNYLYKISYIIYTWFVNGLYIPLLFFSSSHGSPPLFEVNVVLVRQIDVEPKRATSGGSDEGMVFWHRRGGWSHFFRIGSRGSYGYVEGIYTWYLISEFYRVDITVIDVILFLKIFRRQPFGALKWQWQIPIAMIILKWCLFYLSGGCQTCDIGVAEDRGWGKYCFLLDGDIPSRSLAARPSLKSYRNPIGKDRLPTTVFQGRAVSFREGNAHFTTPPIWVPPSLLFVVSLSWHNFGHNLLRFVKLRGCIEYSSWVQPTFVTYYTWPYVTMPTWENPCTEPEHVWLDLKKKRILKERKWLLPKCHGNVGNYLMVFHGIYWWNFTIIITFHPDTSNTSWIVLDYMLNTADLYSRQRRLQLIS